MNDKQEINTLLEKRLPVTIVEDNPNLLQRWGVVKKAEYKIEVKPFPLGVIWQLTDCLIDITDELPDKSWPQKKLAKFCVNNKTAIEKTIAYALNCNSEAEPPEKLFRFMRRNIPSNQVGNIFLFIIIQADLGNFTNAISLATRKLVASSSKAGQKSSE